MLWVVFGFVTFLGTTAEIVFNFGKFGNEKKEKEMVDNLLIKYWTRISPKTASEWKKCKKNKSLL
jgi:hypothetical protein